MIGYRLTRDAGDFILEEEEGVQDAGVCWREEGDQDMDEEEDGVCLATPGDCLVTRGLVNNGVGWKYRAGILVGLFRGAAPPKNVVNIVFFGDLLDEDDDLLDEDGDILDEDGDILDEDGDILDEDGDILDEDGDILDEDGDILDEDGVLIGSFILPKIPAALMFCNVGITGLGVETTRHSPPQG